MLALANVLKKQEEKRKTIAPKIPRVVCLSHYCLSLSTFCPKTIQRMSPGTAMSSVEREDRLDLQS